MSIPRYFGKVAAATALLSAALLPMPCAKAQVNVTTYHNDAARTGQNLLETALTPASVNHSLFTRFGKLFTLPVDGEVYAQPLYLSGVSIPNGGTHNVLYVATEHDSVYAFDAAVGGAPLWKRTLTQGTLIFPGLTNTTVPWSETTKNPDITPEIGITGTPVIDSKAGTLYVVYKTKQVSRRLIIPTITSYHQFLVALDVHTGATKASVEIQGSVPGSGEGGDGHGNVVFSPLHQNQRGALLLSGGVVYVPFGAHGDQTPYHGWVFGYDAVTLHRVSLFCSTPNATSDAASLAGGGIWMAGDGPAADGNGLYVMTGNGKFDADTGGSDHGDSFLRLRPGGLTVADYFTPFNQAALTQSDTDLGSGGNILLPTQPGSHPNLVVGCGKEGKIYLIDRNSMGHFHVGTDAVVQTLPGAVGGTWSTPAYFHGHLYYIGFNDVLKSFPLSGGHLGTTPLRGAPSFGYPGRLLPCPPMGTAAASSGPSPPAPLIPPASTGRGLSSLTMPRRSRLCTTATTPWTIWTITSSSAFQR